MVKKPVRLRSFFYPLLIGYTLMVAAVEFFGSQRAARHFLTDIESRCPEFGSWPLYASGTSFSVFLLWAGAVLFLLSRSCLKPSERNSNEGIFLVSQALMFLFLGFDDRFMLHEGLSDSIGFKDWIFFGILGGLEAGFLLFYGKIFCRGRKALLDIFLAGGFFGLMMFADVLLPYNMILRLSIEDLAKLWSAAFLFKFAWDTCMEKINTLKGGGHIESQ
jgi:hypothetical protein